MINRYFYPSQNGLKYVLKSNKELILGKCYIGKNYLILVIRQGKHLKITGRIFTPVTLWSILVISQNRYDLRGRNQCEPLLNTRVKPLTPTNPAQLLPNFSCRHFCANNDEKQQKMTYFHVKN